MARGSVTLKQPCAAATAPPQAYDRWLKARSGYGAVGRGMLMLAQQAAAAFPDDQELQVGWGGVGNAEYAHKCWMCGCACAGASLSRPAVQAG